MTEAETVAFLRDGLALVKTGAAVVAQFGGTAGSVANIASEMASIGQTVLNASTGLTSDSLTQVSDLTVELQAENDKLAVLVDNS